MTDGTFSHTLNPGSDEAASTNASSVHRAALEWQVTLWSGEVTTQEQQAFERWLKADPAHEQAWLRVQRIGQKLRAAPTLIASPVLRSTAPHTLRVSRRNVLRGMALFGGGVLAYAVRETPQWQTATADYTTARGERQDVTLPDGTLLTLNTATAVDLRFTGQERRLLLRTGEIMVTTAHERAPVYRPFVVETREGNIRALGTKFNVRRLEDHSSPEVLVQVFEGAVEITPHGGGNPVRINAGEQARFSRAGVQDTTAVDPMAAAWSRGYLAAEHQRLADFLAELGRYRSGVLRCDPAVADLPVSGVYPLRDTDAILQSLVQILPVSVRMKTRYWVTVTVREG